MAGLRFKPTSLVLAALVAATLACVAPAVAFADSIEQLGAAYADALQGYEDALGEREQNESEIASIADEIVVAEAAIIRTQDELGETAAALYRETRTHGSLVDLLLGSESFQDAVMRYDLYERVERWCAERIDELAGQRDALASRKTELEDRKAEIDAKVDDAKRAAEEAEKALLDATRSDGASYHQVQGNASNCGATSFVVGVNILLHESRFTDNVAVWKGAGFNRDSTVNLASKGKAWLLANGLGSEIEVEEVAGDVHKASEMKELLEDGGVVVISSGPRSKWQLADGSTAKPGEHAAGHWIVFYRFENGVFYCNDSSVSADKGAGCAYSEEQMQQWLDGRSYHFATVMHKRAGD